MSPIAQAYVHAHLAVLCHEVLEQQKTGHLYGQHMRQLVRLMAVPATMPAVAMAAASSMVVTAALTLARETGRLPVVAARKEPEAPPKPRKDAPAEAAYEPPKEPVMKPDVK